MSPLKIDTSQMKNIVQKIAFLKNYSSLVVSGIIFLVAVIVLLFVQVFLGSNLRENIDRNSVSLGRRVKNLKDSAVSRQQVEVEKKYQDSYEEDVNNIVLLAAQGTKRELLSYKIFPQPKETASLIFEQFRKRYLDGIEAMISKYKGGYALTEEEIREIISRTSTTSTSLEYGAVEISDAVKNELILKRANSINFYVNPSDLAGYNFWRDYKFEDWQKALKHCWSWQLGYWIIEDVIATVGKMDSSYNGVLFSPVKRIISINFVGTSEGSDRSVEIAPSYIITAEGGAQNFLSGIYNSEDIDVLQFNLVVLVDSKSVFSFMKELCSAKVHTFRGFSGEDEMQKFEHNQIVILSSKINLINKQDSEHQLYRYGDSAVFELNLKCQYFLNKNIYAQIKPVFQEGEMETAAPEAGTTDTGVQDSPFPPDAVERRM